MESVASELKSEREKRKISLAQIAADTRISLRHLESLEEGRYADLPGGMYNRAFLRAYCERLNLDQRAIIQRYEAEILPLSEKSLKPKVHIPPQSTSLRISPVVVWSLMLLISATGLFFSRKWISAVFSPYFSHTQSGGVRFERKMPPPDHVAALPSGSSAPATTAPVAPPPAAAAVQPDSIAAGPTTPSPAVLPSGTTVQPAAIPAAEAVSPPASPASTLRLEITATGECWISVDHDGAPAIRKVLKPGEVQSFGARERFLVILGNAGGVNMKINGKPVKPLGKPGEVIKLPIDAKSLPDLINQTG